MSNEKNSNNLNNKISEDKSKTAEDKSKVAENKNKTAEDKSKVAENKNKTAVDKSNAAENKNKTAVDKSNAAENKNKTAVDKSNSAEDKNKTAVDKSKVAENKNKTAVDKSKVAENKNKTAVDKSNSAENKISDDSEKQAIDNTIDESSTVFSEQTYDDKPPKANSAYFKKIIVGVGCIAVSVGIFLLLNAFVFESAPTDPTATSTPTASDAFANNLAIATNSPSDIESITVQNTETYTIYPTVAPAAPAGPDVSATEPVAETVIWNIKDIPANAPMSSNNIGLLVESCANVKANKLIEENATDLAQYGLDTPLITVTVAKKDGTSYKIKVGDSTPNNSGYYVTVDDKNVYLQLSSVNTYGKEKKDFVDQTIIDMVQIDTELLQQGGDPYFSPDPTTGMNVLTSVDSIEVSGTEHVKPYKMEPNELTTNSTSTFTLVSPVINDCNNEVITSILTPLSHGLLSDAAFALSPTDEELKTYGLDNPQHIYTYKFRDQTVTLRFSKTDASGENYAVMTNDIPVIFSVSEMNLPFAQYDLNDMYSIQLFIEDIIAISSIQIEDASGSYKFDITSGFKEADSTAESLLSVMCTTKVIDVEQFKTFYMDLIGVEAKERTDVAAPTTAPLMTITVTYEDTSRKPDVITFTRFDETSDYYQINGQGNAVVYSHHRETISDDVQLLLSGQVIPVSSS